jgi:PTS system beta-glucosides-specific IIC component
MIGGLVGGAVLGLKKVVVYSLPGAGTIFGLPAYIGGGSLSNLMWMGICIVIGMVSTFVATMVLYKPEQK